MKTSVDRILTTHVGSLSRPTELLDLARAKERGEEYDREQYESLARSTIRDAVRRQMDCGLNVVNDCEQGKSSFTAYLTERLSGFEYRPQPYRGPWSGGREGNSFPDYYADYERLRVRVPPTMLGVCTGPISYIGLEALQFDIAALRDATEGLDVEEVFMTALSTTNVEGQKRNEYYATEEEYLQALADAMHEEYSAIVDAGFVLQIDDPRLSTFYEQHPELSLEECRRWAESRVEVLNHALRGIPEDRIRFHTCYSIDIGPRVHDMEMKHLADIMLKVNAGAYSFEAANPRHEHEYRVWEEVKLPDDKFLIPGVITHTTNIVEHPEVVADRIVRYAKVVGRERVMAGADCGFAATARNEADMDIHPSVPWAKFEALVEGAAIASNHLWR